MIQRVIPVEFIRRASSGRTSPVLMTCEIPSGEHIEVIAKFSGFCDEGITNLAREVVSACLARDLNLPVPEPVLIDVTDEFIEIIPNVMPRNKIINSSRVVFGSKFAGKQFTSWISGSTITDGMLSAAASIFVFDSIIQNIDRRDSNPNCLFRGNEFRIFDHELAFTHGLVIGWQAPWKLGGLRSMEAPGNHIFRAGLRGRDIDFGPIRHAWTGLSASRIASYAQQLPPEWGAAATAVDRAVALIGEARDNIDACLAEIQRVLT